MSGVPHGPFPLLGESLALDLVNTTVGRPGRELLGSTAALREWLDAQGERLPQVATVDAGTLDAVRSLRGQVRAAIDAALVARRPPAAALTAIEAAAAAAPRHGRLRWVDGRLEREDVRDGSGAARLTGALAEDAIDLLGGPRAARVRACEAADCVLLFESGGRRRWCSSKTCGNRARVARHYHRHRP